MIKILLLSTLSLTLISCATIDTELSKNPNLNEQFICINLVEQNNSNLAESLKKQINSAFNTYNVYDIATLCKTKSRHIISFSYLNIEEKTQGEIVSLFDENSKFIRSVDLKCEAWGDLPPLLIDEIIDEIIYAHCSSGDNSYFIKEYFTISLDTFEVKKIKTETNNPSFNN